MVDLISEAEKEEAFAAFRDITDTFHKDIVIVAKHGDDFSRMDVGDNSKPELFELLCRVSKEGTEQDLINDVSGADDNNRIEIRFYARYLIEKGLMDILHPNIPLIDVKLDLFYWERIKYRADRWGNDDSDFMGENAIIVFYCRVEPDQVNDMIPEDSGSSNFNEPYFYLKEGQVVAVGFSKITASQNAPTHNNIGDIWIDLT